MAISRQKKESILDILNESFGDAKSVVFAKNKGLTVSDTKDIRGKLRAENITFTVAKKTLFRKAAENNNVEGFDMSILDGAVGAAVSSEDEVIGAKILGTIAKSNENIELVAGIVDGKFLNTEEILNLSLLPSKDELYGKMMGSMLAPLSGFVGISHNLIGGLARCIDQVREQKENA